MSDAEVKAPLKNLINRRGVHLRNYGPVNSMVQYNSNVVNIATYVYQYVGRNGLEITKN